MIRLHRLSGDAFALNPDLIERVEAHPDTVIHLVDDTRYVVRESADDVLAAIVSYRAAILAEASRMNQHINTGARAGGPPRPGGLTAVPDPDEEN